MKPAKRERRRRKMGKRRKKVYGYASDVSDAEWEILAPLIPEAKAGGRPEEIERREIVNGILYVLRSGCPWRLLPHDFPNWSTVYWYFRQWKQAGVWEEVNTVLRRSLRVHLGREAEPSAAIIDSQSVKTSAVRGDERGYDGAKKVQGRKRHLLVDTVGLLLAVKVLSAHIRDRAGGKELLEPLKGKIPRLQLIWADSGYEGAPFRQWVQETLGVGVEITKHPWTGLRGVWVPEGVEVEWDKIIPKGFHILPKRWIVERTNAWVSHCRRLARDFEGTFSSSEAFIFLALSKIMLARLARFSS
jgi:putative transposase